MTRTWPDDWDARKRGVGCWFCGSQLGKPFYAGRAGDAYLERHPIARGHVIVVFRGRHVADFTSLTAAEVAAYWFDVHTVARIIERVFAPCHMNYQLLGNQVPHLHVHLVPRYVDDPAPGRPLPWEPQPLAESEFTRQVELLRAAAPPRPDSTARIAHVSSLEAWQLALARGSYAPPSLESEGYIHCSTPWQVVRIANTNFSGRSDLVLLVIDPARVPANIVFENCEGRSEPFPHIYGPLPIDAVVSVFPLRWLEPCASFEFPEGWQLG